MMMMGKRMPTCLLLMFVFFVAIQAQQNVLQTPDSLRMPQNATTGADAAKKIEKTTPNKLPKDAMRQKADSILELTTSSAFFADSRYFKPSPQKAILYSAIFPGLGQIYNRKYWKLPILYGGFIGLSYAISWNNRYYQDYYRAFKDIMDNDDNTNSWHNFLRYDQTPQTVDKPTLQRRLKEGKDFYRYYRDFSIILTAALYGLAMVDAYVDAQLFDFDISPDLSMRVEPIIMGRSQGNYLGNSFGLQCSIKF